MFTESRFDLCQLNSHPANLDLFVQPSQESQNSVRRVADQIASLIHPRVGISSKRNPDKFFTCELRTVQVAACHAIPSDTEFARNAWRQELEVPVEHVHLCIGNWTTNRNRTLRLLRFAVMNCTPDSRLGRSIFIEELGVRQ